MDLKTGKKTTIDRSAMMFFWSPDGAKIALYSLVTDGKLPQLGYTSGKLAAPALQNNATALRIEVIDAATGDAITVADTVPTRDFLQFFQFFDQYSRAVTPWSPDSSSLVFITVNSVSQTVDVGVATLDKTINAFTLSRVAAGSVAFWSPQ
ncbi:MAG: hypothetical protein HC853_05610 [Anaerolineae bacterium]|nr:hypothetical protein [Anaerolineae bacterium]